MSSSVAGRRLFVPLLSLISELNLLDEFQILKAAGEVKTKSVTAFQALVDLDYLDADRIIQVLCDHLGAESMDLNDALITPKLTKLLPSELARQYDGYKPPEADMPKFGQKLQQELRGGF